LETVAGRRLAQGGLTGGLALGLLALAACAGADTPATGDFRPVGVQTSPVVSAIPVDDLTPATVSAVTTGADQCGAADLQWLVGRSRMEIPVPVNPYARRVTCTTCALTEDYSPTRLNILFDQNTDRVETVRCG
jgi:hypothetical protein